MVIIWWNLRKVTSTCSKPISKKGTLSQKKDVIQRQQNNKCWRSHCFFLPHVNFENHILVLKKLGEEMGGAKNFLREGRNKEKLFTYTY